MSPMERYTRHVLKETQCTAEEREEIEEELLSHLQDLKEYFLVTGHSDKEAERQAIAEFGGSKMIGQGLQESMYPWQRGLLYIIGIASILFGVLFHLYPGFPHHITMNLSKTLKHRALCPFYIVFILVMCYNTHNEEVVENGYDSLSNR